MIQSVSVENSTFIQNSKTILKRLNLDKCRNYNLYHKLVVSVNVNVSV